MIKNNMSEKLTGKEKKELKITKRVKQKNI